MSHPQRKFLEQDLADLLLKLEPDAPARWGKMDARQMVEHLTDFFHVSSGKIKFDLVTPEEHLPKFIEFLRSDKEFRENTKAPDSVLGENPLPWRTADLPAAREKLLQAIRDFYAYYEMPDATPTVHPVFGPLSLEDWQLLHNKHVRHHLRQFSLT
ncbi:MAG: DUF1569 domain-containing protein [Ferruginibacter sp.]